MPLTGELARIDDELRQAYDGDCWHGPPLREILKGVTAAMATARHPQLAHSIWALVKHVLSYLRYEAGRFGLDAGALSARRVLNSGGFVSHSYHIGDGRRSVHMKLATDQDGMRHWSRSATAWRARTTPHRSLPGSTCRARLTGGWCSSTSTEASV